MMDRNRFSRFSAGEALRHAFLSESGTHNDNILAVEMLENLRGFAAGQSLKKLVFVFMMSKKLYSDKDSQIIKLFEAIDTDHDGLIDEIELFNHYGQFFPGTLEQELEKIKSIIHKCDLNQNGKIDYSEFLLFSKDIQKEFIKTDVKIIFDFF